MILACAVGVGGGFMKTTAAPSAVILLQLAQGRSARTISICNFSPSARMKLSPPPKTRRSGPKTAPTAPASRARPNAFEALAGTCLLYTSDAADERSSVDLGGRRIIK